MDLGLFWAVLKRFKRVSITGTVLAVVLAVLAYGTPSPHGITPRGTVTWESRAELLITPATGLYGRADAKTVQLGDPAYMSTLSPVYAGLANGTAVQQAVRDPRVPGMVTATEGVDPNTGNYTPFVTLTATASSAPNAALLVTRGITAFQGFISKMEQAEGVPPYDRIALQVVRNGLPPVIASKPRMTIPILAFLAVMAGMIILVFSMENRDPRSAAALGRLPAVVADGPTAPAAVGNGHVSHQAKGEERARQAAVLDRLIKGR